MARLARIVVPGVPHHVSHRGNRRGDIFLRPEDRILYIETLKEYAVKAGMDIWAYCLMTNHVHLLVTPQAEDSLAKAIGIAHRRYAVRLNKLEGWEGHLWANRFFSAPLDESHLWTAVRYIERNPVRAGLVLCKSSCPKDWG
jgi:REP-associated tyrosine transposase